jgi:hypothetical protein
LSFVFAAAVMAAAPIASVACGGAVTETPASGDSGTPGESPDADVGADAAGDGAVPDYIPQPNVIAHVSAMISAVAMDDTTIYFACDDGSIQSVPKDGSAPPKTIAQAMTTYTEGIAVDATDVYFTNLAPGTIQRVPKGGGVPETIATGQLRPQGITLDATQVYWANQGTDAEGAPGNDGSIMALAKSGGTPVVLVSGEQMPVAIALEGTQLVWGDGPWGSTNAMIRTLDLAGGGGDAGDGGVPSSLASGLDNLWVPAIAGGRVYFTVGGGTDIEWDAGLLSTEATISSVPLAGGPTTVLSRFTITPLAIGADDAFLYYGTITNDLTSGTIRKIPLGGGTAVDFAPAPQIPGPRDVGDSPQFMLVDATRVYVVDYYATRTGGEQGLVRAYGK